LTEARSKFAAKSALEIKIAGAYVRMTNGRQPVIRWGTRRAPMNLPKPKSLG